MHTHAQSPHSAHLFLFKAQSSEAKDQIRASENSHLAKEQPAKEQPAKEQPPKEQPAKEQPAKEQPPKEQPAKEHPAK